MVKDPSTWLYSGFKMLQSMRGISPKLNVRDHKPSWNYEKVLRRPWLDTFSSFSQMATCLWYLLSLSKPVLRNTQRHSIAKQRRMSLTEAERRHQGTSAWSRVPSDVPPLCFLTLSDHLSDHLYALFIYIYIYIYLFMYIYIYQLNSTDRSDSWNSSLSSSIAYVSYVHTAKSRNGDYRSELALPLGMIWTDFFWGRHSTGWSWTRWLSTD